MLFAAGGAVFAAGSRKGGGSSQGHCSEHERAQNELNPSHRKNLLMMKAQPREAACG
jgi:hypothetical protein